MLISDFAVAALSIASVASVPPPVAVGLPRLQSVMSWIPGDARCEGRAIDAAAIQRPLVEVAVLDPQYVRPVTYRFAVDASGRARSVAREGTDFMAFIQDLGPSLAASRFAAGAPSENCELRYSPKIEPLSDAAIKDLVAYSILSDQRLPKEGWDRFTTVGTCRDKPRQITLLRGFPDFRKVPSTPGAKDWALVAYDTDAKGRPINARIAHGTGNRAMEGAAIKALRKSRFSGGARTGCLFPYWRAAGRLDAPEKPTEGQMRPAGAICPEKIDWASRPTSHYPPAYRNRAVEGWAIVAFDTAPWGEVGNVRVLAAQPSADFGQQAVQIVRSGRVKPSAQGASGCVETVNFQMPDDYMTFDGGDAMR